MEPWHSFYDTCFNTDKPSSSNPSASSPREQSYDAASDAERQRLENIRTAERDKKYLKIVSILGILAIGAVAAFCIWNPYKQNPQQDDSTKKEEIKQERASDKEGLKDKIQKTEEIRR